MAIVALLILAYLIFLLAGNKGLFQTNVDVYTFLDDAVSIADGSPVTLNGINIGKVLHAELSGSTAPNRAVRVTLRINTEMLKSIPVDSQAYLTSANLLGTKYINIKKGKNPETIQAGAGNPKLGHA